MVIKKFRIISFKEKKPLVSFKKISLSFGQRQILDDISFDINRGEILGLLGPNGVGKSTLFNLLTGMIKPNYGKILFDNINIENYPIYLRSSKFKIGYVPQYAGYFHNLTLIENMRAIGEILTKDKKQMNHKIENLIAKFELDAVRNIKAKFLSGGQKKRCVICLALLGEPQILLMDEPFQALDLLTVQMLQGIIVNLQTENPKMSIVISDHAARDLLEVVDSAIVLSNCKIVAKGSPSVLLKNANARSAYFGESFKFKI